MDKIDLRFMFDTNTVNKIAQNSSDEMDIYDSITQGYEYYFTDIQPDESGKAISSHKSGNTTTVYRKDAEYAINLLKIISRLQTRHVKNIATLCRFGWLLDGSYDFLPDNETLAGEMFFDILNSNERQYYNDAMIALTCIVNGCTLVTNDKRLFNKVNKHFPGRAIRYEDFIVSLRG